MTIKATPQPTDLLLRLLFDKKTLTPVGSSFNEDVDPFLTNQENLMLVYVRHNRRTLKTEFAFYKFEEGVPRTKGVLFLEGVNKGIAAMTKDHQAAANWALGMIEQARIGKIPLGSYFMPRPVVRKPTWGPGNVTVDSMIREKMIKEGIWKVKPNSQCVEMIKGLKHIPDKKGVRFEILQLDEGGAPNALSEMTIGAEKLRCLIRQRFNACLFADARELTGLFANVISNCASSVIINGIENCQAYIADEVGRLQVELSEHVYTHWVEADGTTWLKPWYSRMERVCTKLINFIPTLVQNQESFTLNVCSIDEDHDPLLLVVRGSPVRVVEDNLPPKFFFPKTWKNSPFEAATDERVRQEVRHRMTTPQKVVVHHATPIEEPVTATTTKVTPPAKRGSKKTAPKLDSKTPKETAKGKKAAVVAVTSPEGGVAENPTTEEAPKESAPVGGNLILNSLQALPSFE